MVRNRRGNLLGANSRRPAVTFRRERVRLKETSSMRNFLVEHGSTPLVGSISRLWVMRSYTDAQPDLSQGPTLPQCPAAIP